MKRKKLERLIVEIIEDREALIAEMAALDATPSEDLTPIDQFRVYEVPGARWPYLSGGSTTTRCTCPPNRGDNYHGSCLVHDVQVWS